MMILFHVVFDLSYFGEFDLDIYSGFWWFFARTTAFIFILIAGISLTLSYSRARVSKSLGNLRVKFFRRALRIFSWGLVISLITWIFLRDGFIVFGVLHFIGVSIVLSYSLLRYRYLNLLLGSSVIALGVYLSFFSFDFPWLLWLGFRPQSLYTFDYFPLFPWFGAFLVGLFFGNLLYPDYVRNFNPPDLSGLSFIRFFCFLGRHSLLIYFIHQPILISILFLLGVDVISLIC